MKASPDMAWRMIRAGGGTEKAAHLIVPGVRNGRDAYLLVACGKGWNTRSVRELRELGTGDVKCPECLFKLGQRDEA